MELKENFMYVCFHRGKGVIGKAIAWWTLGLYSHAEFVYNGKKYLANPGGIRMEDYCYKPSHDLYELNYIVNIEKILDFFSSTENLPYDWKAIKNAQFKWGDDRIKDQNVNEYFCSEFVLHAIDYALNYKLTYEGKGVNEKGYFKFNPNRLYTYLKEQQLIDRKVEK